MKFKIIIIFVMIDCVIRNVRIKATRSDSLSSSVAFSPSALHHSLHINYFSPVIGQPTIQASHVLKAEHLKSKASQYPNCPASIVAKASPSLLFSLYKF